MIKLRGMTWDHERGYNPLVAVTEKFKDLYPNVEIEWDKRSLQAFADRPLDVIAQEYDFMIIDHPHIGEASQQGCIIPLDEPKYQRALDDLARNSAGPSHESYNLDGRQWALPVDAACQVACFRSDLIDQVPKNWEEVLELAKEGKVLWPLKPVDAVDSFFTLCANLGQPVAESTEKLTDEATARRVLELMKSVSQYIPQDNLQQNPIDVLEVMSKSDRYAYCPLLFGYINYSCYGFRTKQVDFCDMPALEGNNISGSIIGGTGLAISAKCKHQDIAKDFAYFAASGEIQSSIYFDADGQPAHMEAWKNQRANDLSRNFFLNTIETTNQSWLRPRYNGFLHMADVGGDLINEYLQDKLSIDEVMEGLEEAYQNSLSGDKTRKYE